MRLFGNRDREYKDKALAAVAKVSKKLKGLELAWGDIPVQDVNKLELPTEWAEYLPKKWGSLIPAPTMPGTLFMCDIQDGDSWPPHYHADNTEWLFILTGSLDCYVKPIQKQDEEYKHRRIGRGEAIMFPRNHAHHVRAIGYCLYLVYWIPALDGV